MLVCGVACGVGACVAGGSPSATTEAVTVAGAPTAAVGQRPEWRPGDQWTYGWTAEARTGTKVVEVLDSREIGGVFYYAARNGDVDHLFTRDLQWAGALRDGRVEIRMVPPLPWFVWPLETGRRWSHRATYQDPNGARQRDDSFAVIGEEWVEVPAGRFRTLKVVREGSDRDSDEYWYASEVRFYVKWIGRRGNTQFQELLQSYRAVTRLIPPPGVPAPPSNEK